MSKQFRVVSDVCMFIPCPPLKHHVVLDNNHGRFVVASLNDLTTAETLAIELNELVTTYVESEALAAITHVTE